MPSLIRASIDRLLPSDMATVYTSTTKYYHTSEAENKRRALRMRLFTHYYYSARALGAGASASKRVLRYKRRGGRSGGLQGILGEKGDACWPSFCKSRRLYNIVVHFAVPQCVVA